MLHSLTWVVWTASITAIAILTRNPLYITLVLGTIAVNHAAVSKNRPDAAGWHTLLRIAMGLALFTIPLNALSVHTGSHILFQLPVNWPIVGGKITLEAVVWGACSALSLMTLMLLFATFNLAVNQAQILRLTPGFIYEAGLIVSIALTFFPQMMVSAKEIHEAQLIRGHRIRRVRDMLPFVMALLTTGLERSLQLAESMEARGFGNVRALPRTRDVLYKAFILLGLGGFLVGFFALTYLEAFQSAGWTIVVLNALLLAAVFWAQGKRITRTHYRRERMTRHDGIVLIACLGIIAGLIWLRIYDAASLSYYPYTDLVPPFQPAIGIALLAFILPAIVQRRPPVP